MMALSDSPCALTLAWLINLEYLKLRGRCDPVGDDEVDAGGRAQSACASSSQPWSAQTPGQEMPDTLTSCSATH